MDFEERSSASVQFRGLLAQIINRLLPHTGAPCLKMPSFLFQASIGSFRLRCPTTRGWTSENGIFDVWARAQNLVILCRKRHETYTITTERKSQYLSLCVCVHAVCVCVCVSTRFCLNPTMCNAITPSSPMMTDRCHFAAQCRWRSQKQLKGKYRVDVHQDLFLRLHQFLVGLLHSTLVKNSHGHVCFFHPTGSGHAN